MQVKKMSRKQEERTAKQFGGKTLPGSGCIDGLKGDVRADKFLIENKYTTSFYTLKKSTWDKIVKEALHDNFREPLIQLDFMPDAHSTHSYVIMETAFYEDNFDEIPFNTIHAKKSIKLVMEDVVSFDRYDIIFSDSCSLTMIKLEDFLYKFGEENK